MKIVKTNILGTEYVIFLEVTEKDDKRISLYNGFTDFNTKEIYVAKTKTYIDSCKSPEIYEKKILRHEIIHAYLHESGLDENSYDVKAWAENEEMIDFFAMQFPKITKTFVELNVLDLEFIEKYNKNILIKQFANHIAMLQKRADRYYYIENNKDMSDFVLNEVFAIKKMCHILNICDEVYEEAYKIYDFRNSGKKDFILTEERKKDLEKFYYIPFCDELKL